MNNPVNLTGKTLDGFLSKLSQLVDALPSQETKSRLDRELGVLIAFLNDFRTRLRSFPTGEDTEGVTSTIEAMKDLVRVVEADPTMSHFLGFSSEKKTLRKSSRRALTMQDREEAKAMATKLQTLPSEDIDRILADKKTYTIPMLKQLGGELGLNFPSKSTRLSIIEKISKKIANLRGYDYLRHGHMESQVAKEAGVRS